MAICSALVVIGGKVIVLGMVTRVKSCRETMSSNRHKIGRCWQSYFRKVASKSVNISVGVILHVRENEIQLFRWHFVRTRAEVERAKVTRVNLYTPSIDKVGCLCETNT